MKLVQRFVVMVILTLITAVIIHASPYLPNKAYGESATWDEKAFALAQDREDLGLGYVMAGSVIRNIKPVKLYFPLVVKVDYKGTVVWAREFWTGDNYELHDTTKATSMIRTSDGNFVITGYWKRKSDECLFIYKLGSNGSLLWGKAYKYRGNSSLRAFSIIQDRDLNLIVVGRIVHDLTAGSPNILFMKVDPSNGAIIYSKEYRRTPKIGTDEAYSVTELPVGGHARYAVVGRTQTTTQDPMNPYDAFVMFLNVEGIVKGVKIIPGCGTDEAYSVVSDGIDSCAWAGWTNSFGPGNKTTPTNANIFFCKTTLLSMTGIGYVYGWSSDTEKIMSDKALIKTSSTGAGYALSGWTNSYGPGTPQYPNLLLLRLYDNGLFCWGRVHPSADTKNYAEQGYPIIEAQQENTSFPYWSPGFTTAGWTNSFGSSPVGVHPKFELFTLDINGHRPACTIDISLQPDSLLYSPDSMVWNSVQLDTASKMSRSVKVLTYPICK